MEVSETRLIGRSRRREIVRARQVTCYVLRAVWPQLSYPCIAILVGGRDHSTVIHSCRKIADLIARDPELLGIVTGLVAAFGRQREVRQHDSHVIAWRAHRGVLARHKAVRSAGRDVLPAKPVNARVPDDHDAVRHERGVTALGAAIAAAGGWPGSARAAA